MQVLSVHRSSTDNCILVGVGYDEPLTVALPGEEKAIQNVIQQAMQFVQSLMPLLMPQTRKVVKATLCLTDEEYEILQKPTVGDEVDLQVSPEGVVTIRFIKH
jgi:hypothetical protein